MPESAKRGDVTLTRHLLSQHEPNPGRLALRHKENFVRVRILHFSAGRESFHVNIFAGRIRAFH